MQEIKLRLPESVIADLDRAAKASSTTRSELIRSKLLSTGSEERSTKTLGSYQELVAAVARSTGAGLSRVQVESIVATVFTQIHQESNLAAPSL